MENKDEQRESLLISCLQSRVGGSHLNKWVKWSAKKDPVEVSQSATEVPKRDWQGQGKLFKRCEMWTGFSKMSRSLLQERECHFRRQDQHIKVPRNIQGHGSLENRETSLLLGMGGQGLWIEQRGGLRPYVGGLAVQRWDLGLYLMRFLYSFIHPINTYWEPLRYQALC